MQNSLGIIIFMWYWLILPLGMGYAITYKYQEAKLAPIAVRYVCGFVLGFAIYQVSCNFAMWFGFSLSVSQWIYIVVTNVVALFGVCLFCKDKRKVRSTCWIGNTKRTVYFYLALIIIAWQIYTILTMHMQIYEDDVYYVPWICDMAYGNNFFATQPHDGSSLELGVVISKYVFTSYYPYMAVLSRICTVHPLILTKTWILPFYQVMFYLANYIFAKWLFKDSKKEDMYLFFLAILVEFSGISFQNFGVYFYQLLWNGKGALFVAILPTYFIFLYMIMYRDIKKKDLFLLSIIILAAIGCSSMVFSLIPIMTYTLALVMSVRARSIKKMIQGIVVCWPVYLYGALMILRKMEIFTIPITIFD